MSTFKYRFRTLTGIGAIYRSQRVLKFDGAPEPRFVTRTPTASATTGRSNGVRKGNGLSWQVIVRGGGGDGNRDSGVWRVAARRRSADAGADCWGRLELSPLRCARNRCLVGWAVCRVDAHTQFHFAADFMAVSTSTGLRAQLYNPFTVTSVFPEALPMFYLQDIPPPPEQRPKSAATSDTCVHNNLKGEWGDRLYRPFTAAPSKHSAVSVDHRNYLQERNVNSQSLGIESGTRHVGRSTYREPVTPPFRYRLFTVLEGAAVDLEAGVQITPKVVKGTGEDMLRDGIPPATFKGPILYITVKFSLMSLSFARLTCSPPTQGDPGSILRIFARGNRAGRYRWPAGFLGDLPFPRPLLFQRCSMLTSITLIGSQDLIVKNRPNFFTRSLHSIAPAVNNNLTLELERAE
ncbi:hypothetical protein PR048_023949 [Dryococelus australis]|uniref:Uncharacterized protein n=1 Tax=Dryococelus australis TaxID=614101 RepID=A0ABQ9GVI6_9NEOP|nr:hypothetical protein PR048_023949 [Dryococelus australis]